MRAEIKALYSLDVHDLEGYSPVVPDSFSLNLRLIVGPYREAGEESFDVQVCTPKWLMQNFGCEEVIVGRHLLIVFEYNFARIKSKIEKFVTQCAGKSWEEVALKVARLGYWEFEDYVGSPTGDSSR